jgi:hypothetical protein
MEEQKEPRNLVYPLLFCNSTGSLQGDTKMPHPTFSATIRQVTYRC